MLQTSEYFLFSYQIKSYFFKPFLNIAIVGAGCGLTTIALLKKGFKVIATDRKIALPLLSSNIQAYLAERSNRKRNNMISTSINLSPDDNDADVSEFAQVVEFDWQQSFMACASCPSSASYSDKSIDLIEALRSLSSTSNSFPPGSSDPNCCPSESNGDPGCHTISYPDLLVCSDCIYASASVKPLLQALSWVSWRQHLSLLKYFVVSLSIDPLHILPDNHEFHSVSWLVLIPYY